MGLYIHLTINPLHISAEQWEVAYQESLLLLRQFPVPLLRFTVQERAGLKRYAYTAAIEDRKNQPEENWEIIGDFISYQHGEAYQLYRQPAQQFRNRQRLPDKDVLWAEEEEIDQVDGNGWDVFGDKTQGYPYHLAVLAVAMLFESRFPGQAFVFGDIEHQQVEEMVAWVNALLPRPVSIPVCFNGEQLYARLTALYPDPALRLKRFKRLFLGAEEEAMALLIQLAGEGVVMADMLEDLCHYSSLHQIGATDLLGRFLSVTQDVRRLIEFVQAAGRSAAQRKPFPLEDLLKVLVQNFVTFGAAARAPLDLFARSSTDLFTIEDAFTQIFLRMGGTPSAFEFTISSADLLKIFAAYEPQQRAHFRQIIKTEEKACRQRLKETQSLIEQLETRAAPPESAAQATAEAATGPDAKQLSAPIARPGVAYILHQVYRQRQRFPEPERVAKVMGQKLQEIVQANAKHFSSNEAYFYHEAISRAGFNQGITLRESAWTQIDAEQNIALLRCLLALTLISERESTFWRWRIYLLEYKELWPHLLMKELLPARQSGQSAGDGKAGLPVGAQ